MKSSSCFFGFINCPKTQRHFIYYYKWQRRAANFTSEDLETANLMWYAYIEYSNRSIIAPIWVPKYIHYALLLLGPRCSVQGSVRPPCVPGRDAAETQHGHSRTLLPHQVQQRGNRHGYCYRPAPHCASCRHRSETVIRQLGQSVSAVQRIYVSSPSPKQLGCFVKFK